MVGFIFQSLFLGVGLAMDATCVAMTNGLNYPCLKKKQAFLIAFMFGFFQALMPLIGYLLGVNFSNFLTASFFLDPSRPITAPGLAVCKDTITFLPVRLISIRAT